MSQRPQQPIELKLVESLERLSRVFKVLFWEEAKRARISPLQVQILLYLHENPHRPGGVSRLAMEFGVTQATISDAVRSLEEKGYLTKAVRPEDRRLKLLKLSLKGHRLAIRAERRRARLEHRVASAADGRKQDTLHFLLELLRGLQEEGFLTDMRLCLSCRNFEHRGGPVEEPAFYCTLTQTPLVITDVNFNCPEFLPRRAIPTA
jgi:DNA-binding MarR family transcriptional regulator